MSKEKTEVVSFRTPKSIAVKLGKEAKKNKKSRSEFVSDLCASLFEKVRVETKEIAVEA